MASTNLNVKNLVNLTPHPITIEGVGTIPPSGKVARVEVKRVTVGTVHQAWVEISTLIPTGISGLPERVRYRPELTYIVSAMVLSALADMNIFRCDVFAPDTDRATRNERGQIVSVPGLVAQLPKVGGSPYSEESEIAKRGITDQVHRALRPRDGGPSKWEKWA